MATEADIPVPACEAARGDQVGTIVDNIIKISVSQLSLENQTQDDKHNELPIVEGENFLKSPSNVEVHCEATPEISPVIEDPDQKVKEGVDTLLLGTTETSSDLNSTSDSFTEKIGLTKEILQETSLPGEETESHTPCISESEEVNVEMKTIDEKSADEKSTEEDMSSDLTNKVASEKEGSEIEEIVEENLDALAEKTSHESVTTPGETITKEDGVFKEAEQSTSVKEDDNIENHAESLHVAPENIDVPELSHESRTEGPPEEQSRDVTLHGNTTEAEEATIDTDDEHKKNPESFPPTVSSIKEEGSMNPVPKVGTSDHTDGETIVEVHEHKEALESSSDVSKSTENTDQMTKDDTDNLLLSPKLSDQPVESAANEETSGEEIQHAEESNSSEKYVEPEQHNKDDTRVVTQLPNETSSDHRSINDSSTETVAISEEKLQEINLPSEEILPNAPCNESVDEEPRKQDMSYDLTNGVSKEGESDQNEIASKQEGLQNNHHMDGNQQEEVHENLSSGEAHCEVNNLSPDVSKNAEESDSTDKDVVPERINDSPVVTSEIDDPEMEKGKVMTQLSKDPSSDRHVTNDSSTENAAVTDEIVQETNPSNEEIESDVACISEAEELNTDSKYADEKPTEEDIPCDLTNDDSKKEEVGQDKMTSEQEILEKETADEVSHENITSGVSHENITSGETITTLETFNTEELQSKSSLLSKEEETAVEEGDRSVSTSDDIRIPSGNTLSHGDVECQSKTLEDEEQKLADFSESKQSPRCAPVEEDVQIENPAESLHVGLESVEVSNSSQESKTEVLPEEETLDAADSHKDDHESFPPIVSGSLEEGNVNAVLPEVASDHTVGIIDVVDKNEEAIENPSTTVSTEDAEGNSLSKLDHSENKREDDSVKECEDVTLPQPSATKVGDAPTYLHEAQFEDGEPEKAEECDYEKSTESLLLTTESRKENTEDKHVNFEQQIEGGTVDVAEEKEETLENVSAIVLNEKMEENSYIEVDREMQNVEHLDEENEQLSSAKDCTGNIDNDEGNVKDEGQIEDENRSGVELFESNKNTESDEIEETAVDAATTNEKSQEQNVSNENSDKDLSVEVDATEMKHETNLEEEQETPSHTEASKEDPNDDESTILPEPKTDLTTVEVPADEKSTDSTTPEGESLQLEDHTASTPSADIETTCSLSDETIDATDKELTLEDASQNEATEITGEHTEENSVAQVDFTESEQDEHLEKDNQDSSVTKALESKHINELNDRGEDSIKSDLENGGNTKTTSVKEETDMETPIDSLHVKPEDIKQQDSSADINSSIEEQCSTIDPQEISSDNTERESFETAQTNEECVEIKDVAKDIPVCDKEDSIQIEEVDSPNPLNEASEGNANNDGSTKITQDCLIKEGESLESLQVAAQDIETPPLSQDRELSYSDDHSPITPEGIMDDNKEEIADNATGFEGESPEDKDTSIPNGDSEDNLPNEVDVLQKPSSEEVTAENIDNDKPTTTHEAKLANENDVKANLSENEEKSECAFVEGEEQIDSLQVADEDIKDREASHFEEQEPATGSQEATDDREDAETLDSTDLKEEILENKNHETTPQRDTNEDSLQVDGSILEEKGQPENDSESTPLSDAQKDDIIGKTSVTEVEQVENSIDSSQAASEATEVVAPCQDTERSYKVEQILGSEDISGNEVIEKIADATGEEIQETQVTSIPNGNSEDNLPKEVDVFQNPSSEEVTSEKIDNEEPTTTHEAKLPNENAVKANLSENEEKTECAFVKGEEQIDSLQGADEDIKDSSSAQDREASHLVEQEPTTDSQGATDDQEDAETLDSTDLKEEILENKNHETTPQRDTNEDSLQGDGSILEEKEQPEKDGESTPLTDAQKQDIIERTLVTEVEQLENSIDSSQVASEATEIVAPCQDTERSYNEEQILGSEDISGNEVIEKIADATGEEIQDTQGLAESITHEDDTTNEQNTEAALENEDLSTESPQVADEDREEPCLSEVRETSYQEEQILSSSPGVLINDNKENKATEPTVLQKEIPKDEVLREMESIDVQAATNEEEGYLKGVETTTANDVANSFSDEKIPAEMERETVANDILPASNDETPGVHHSPTEEGLRKTEEPCTRDDEEKSDEGNGAQKEACEENMPDLETQDDQKAPEIKETTPSSEIDEDAENASVEESSDYAVDLAKDKSDSNEVATMPIETKSGHDSNDQGLEAVDEDQSCDIIPKIEEEKLEEDAERQFDKAVKEDIQEEIIHKNEIVKDDILSEKEQLPRINEDDEDIQEHHQGSCDDEKITESHQEEEVNQDPQIVSRETDGLAKNGHETETEEKVCAEIDDKAPEDIEEKILASEAVETILHREDQVTSNEELTIDTDNEKANELDIACVQTDTRDKEEGDQIAVIPGRESDEHNQKYISSSGEMQAKDEEELKLSEEKSEEEAKETLKEACVEAEKLEFASHTKEMLERAIGDDSQDIPEENENSATINKFSEEDCPNKSKECEVPSAGEDAAITEQSSDETIVTAEVHEVKTGIDLDETVPEAAGLESHEVDEVNDECVKMADTSGLVENPVVSTSKTIPELAEETPVVTEYPETKLQSLPEEINTKDSEVKTAEIDDAVNVESVRDISEEREESFEASINEKPVEGDPEQKIETSEVQETEPIQSASVPETVKQEPEEQKLVRGTEDVHEEEKSTYNIIPKQLESSYGAEPEKVSEPSIHLTSMEDTTQHENKEENQQNDSPLFLPHAQCSDIKTSEKDLSMNIGGLHTDDASEQRDKHVVLQADDTKNLNTENLDIDSSKIPSEISRAEHETVNPPKHEREKEECREEGTNQEMKAKPESEENSPMADHSPTGKVPTSHTEDLQAEETDEVEHENSKTDEEREIEDESSREHEKSDLSSEAPVMVDMGDADVKVTPKKSHNILSGVGSKVKHSIAKVKKAITGKSSHPKTPSPSKVVNST